jgi:hypothetical protein
MANRPQQEETAMSSAPHLPLRKRLLAARTGLFGLVLGVLVCWGALGASATDLSGLDTDLKELEKALKNGKSNNDQIEQYLDEVANGLKSMAPPPAPEPLPADANEEQKAAHAKKQAEHDKLVAAYEKGLPKAKKDVLDAMLDALTLVKVQNGVNQRDQVNLKAAARIAEVAELLDEKGRKDLTKDLIKAVDALGKRKDPTVNSDVLAATFATMAKTGDLSGLQWMADNFLHTKDNEKDSLVAAHKAMILYKNVPGKMRYAICDEMIKQYSSVESQAEQSSPDAAIQAKKRFWDAIKTDTIPCVQYFAGQPKDAEGRALAKMAEFQSWWRDVKNPNKAPWVDDDK